MSTISQLPRTRTMSPTWTVLCLAMAAIACDGPLPVGDAGIDSGQGTVCRSDRDCSSAGQVCDRSTGYCVECVTGADCAAGQACRNTRCEEVTPCTSSRMCPGLVCDVDRGYCVECVTEVDCTGDDVCRDGDCVPPPRPCDSDRQCSDIGLVCDTAAGHCVECLREADCPADRYCGDNRTCLPDACTAGETRCASSTQIETCLPDGSGFGAADACGPARECADGACRALGMDAGTDAGMLLDGGNDSGIADAGVALDAGAVTRYALSFDGDGDEVEFPMSFGDVGQRFTYELWVRPTSADAGLRPGGRRTPLRPPCRLP